MHSAEPKPTPPKGPHESGRRFYRALALFTGALIVIIPLASLLMWFNLLHLNDPSVGRRFVMSEETGALRRLGAFGIALLPKLVLLYGLLRLSRLFQSCARGFIFTAETEGHLRYFGLSVLFYVIADFIMEAPLSVFVSWTNPPGDRFLTLSFGTHDLQFIFLGGFAFALSYMVAEGIRLARENAEFV